MHFNLSASHGLDAVDVNAATNLPIAIAWHDYTKTWIQIVTRFAATAFVFSRQGIISETLSHH